MHFKKFLLVFAAMLILGTFGCNKKEPSGSPVVARVNNHYLTLEEANKRLLSYSNENITLEDVVSSWIDTELLYMAALKNDFDKDKTLQNRLLEFRRRLLGDAYLESVLQRQTHITNSMVKDFYEKYKSSFVRTSDEALINHFVLNTKTEANRVKKVLSKHRSGGERKELFASYRVEAVVVKKGFLINALDKAVFSSRKAPAVIGPVADKKRYHVIEVLKRYKKGSSYGLDKVYDEILQRLIQQQKTLKGKRVLDSLRTTSNIEINMELIR
ncbi:MAG: hypothetical protein GXO92_08435 [FCB group bacterium]|nr:hypothetical protein [FCB group bacterium]